MLKTSNILFLERTQRIKGEIVIFPQMIVASETGQIPPNLHYDKPNSEAPGLKEGRIRIPTELTPWSGEYYSVNTTAVSGVFTNALLKPYKIEKKNNGVPDDDLPRLVIVSGRTEESISTLLKFVSTAFI